VHSGVELEEEQYLTKPWGSHEVEAASFSSSQYTRQREASPSPLPTDLIKVFLCVLVSRPLCACAQVHSLEGTLIQGIRGLLFLFPSSLASRALCGIL